MHFLTEAEWRAHRAEVTSLVEAFITLAKGVHVMSTATAALKQDVADLKVKFDQFIASKTNADAAKLAEDEAEIATIKADVDALSASIDAAMAPVVVTDTAAIDTSTAATIEAATVS